MGLERHGYIRVFLLAKDKYTLHLLGEAVSYSKAATQLDLKNLIVIASIIDYDNIILLISVDVLCGLRYVYMHELVNGDDEYFYLLQKASYIYVKDYI